MISVAAKAGTLSGRNLSASYGSSGRTLPIVYCLMESDASSITPALRSTSSRAFLCSSSYEIYPMTPRPVTNTASNTRLNFRRRPMFSPFRELTIYAWLRKHITAPRRPGGSRAMNGAPCASSCPTSWNTSGGWRRHSRDLDLIVLFIIFHNSSHPGVRACRGSAAQEVRLALRRGHLRRRGDLHHVHRAGHRVAHGHPPARQRARLEGQHARHRQPAELRNGEVLRQRGIRGAALRREPAGL